MYIRIQANIYLLLTTILILTACSPDKNNIALGTMERDRILLKSTADEIIIAEPISEGSFVTQGTVILQLDDRRQKAVLTKSQAQLAIATAQFEKLRNGARIEDIDVAKSKVNGANAILLSAIKNHQRNITLKKQGLIPQETLDNSLANKDSAQANFQSASESLLALTNGSRKEDLDQAQATVNAAQSQVDLEMIKLSELTITATRDGHLQALPYHIGERVNSGTVVAILLANNNPFARVYVPEPYRVNLRIGDPLTVRVDGLNQNLKGRLRWIDNNPSFTPYYALNEEDRARLVYVAEIELIDALDIPSGIPAQVDLNQ